MTTPPKARRYHISRDESVLGGAAPSSAEDAGQTAAPDQPSGPHIETRKKAELPPRFGTGPVPRPVPDNAPDEADAEEARREKMMETGPVEDGFGDTRFPGAEADGKKTPGADRGDDQTGDGAKAVSDAAAPTNAAPNDVNAVEKAPQAGPALEAKLAEIRAEKLSERQLRIARRIATLHQITVNSDEEAVLRLRERGIDPSHRAAVGRILSAEGARAQAGPAANTPVVLPRPAAQVPGPARPVVPAEPAPKPDLPSRKALTEERRAEEIGRIQRDIMRRRRRRMMFLAARLAFFVLAPTFLMGWYYFRLATPLYATQAQFQIQQASSEATGGAGGLFGATQLATNTDSVAVQSYLSSREAMLRLNEDKGFKRAFQDPAIDPVKRLAPNATNEATYRVYQDSVKIGYDPTEGMINLEVIAPDPKLSEEFSLALIGYAEGQVDSMTARLRDDQMKGAVANYEAAETKVLDAQRRVQDLQQKLGVLDPAAEGGVVMGQVAALEGQLATKQLELGQLLANPRPQQSRVAALEGDIERLQSLIADTRAQLTEGNAQRASLASISGELRIAESDLETRQSLLAAAAEQLEVARIEANKQVRYLSLSVVPVPPDEATYPKAFQNTLVSLLVFSGIYLMLSLTASILREQVSA